MDKFYELCEHAPEIFIILSGLFSVVFSLISYKRTGKILGLPDIQKADALKREEKAVADDMQNMKAFHENAIKKIDKALEKDKDNQKLLSLRTYHLQMLDEFNKKGGE